MAGGGATPRLARPSHLVSSSRIASHRIDRPWPLALGFDSVVPRPTMHPIPRSLPPLSNPNLTSGDGHLAPPEDASQIVLLNLARANETASCLAELGSSNLPQEEGCSSREVKPGPPEGSALHLRVSQGDRLLPTAATPQARLPSCRLSSWPAEASEMGKTL